MCVVTISENLDTAVRKMQKNRRVMAHYVVCNGCVYSNSILGFDPQGNYEVVPFTHEIASTEFVSGVAAVCNADIDMAMVKGTFCNRSSMDEFAQWLVAKCGETSGQKVILKFYSDGTIARH